jgi:cell division septum initiation protein DivIVA
MSEESQFRTVLRGFDPEQVKSAMDEMHTSVVTARRLAADRTIEVTRMQDHLNQVQRRLDEATARIAELEKQSPQSAPSAGDVGARIGSILALANEEAEELRAAGRDQAQRTLAEADASARAARSEAERHADEVRLTARGDADRVVDEARQRAAALLADANRDADARRAEAQAIVDSHRAQADAVAAFSGQIAKHTDRLQQASTRVEQLAHEEAMLVQRQGQESTERIQRDTENQLAAVDARRQSITAQLSTVGELLQQLGRAVGPDAVGPDAVGPDAAGPDDAAARPDAPGPALPAEAPTEVMTEVMTGVDVVEVAEHAFDHSADVAGRHEGTAAAHEASHQEAGVRR